MNNVNDTKIIELKKQILEKRNKLDGINKFIPITNCSIELDGERYNIQVLGVDQLISLVIKLNSYICSARDLGLLERYIISGYGAESWVTDIRARLDILSRKDEEKKLKTMESKLDELLSNEKKVELELSEIEDMLK